MDSCGMEMWPGKEKHFQQCYPALEGCVLAYRPGKSPVRRSKETGGGWKGRLLLNQKLSEDCTWFQKSQNTARYLMWHLKGEGGASIFLPAQIAFHSG